MKVAYEIDFSNHPKRSIEDLDKAYKPNMLLVIEEIFSSEKTFALVMQDLIDIMKYGFEIEKVRKRKIFFKFKVEDEKEYSMQMNNFISNLCFWHPMLAVDKARLLDESWIFDFSKFNSNTLAEYVDNKILPMLNTDFASKNAIIDELYHNIVCISNAFCLLMGMSLSLYDLHKLEERHPEVSRLMREDIDPSLTPSEMEKEAISRTDKIIQIMITDNEMNDYKPFFASDAGLKKLQFKEFVTRIGFKADINGNTIPLFINNNFLLHGLNRPSYYYINSLSGRKALMLSKLAIGKPSALSKKIVMNSLVSTLRKDSKMCNSVKTTDYIIHDDGILSQLHGRYYYDANNNLKLLDYETDKDLIGLSLRFRGPATCNSKNGVCKYCYGHLFEMNQSMTSVGALAGLKTTQPFSQTMLKAKHYQGTNSSDLKLTEGFEELFELNGSVISTREDSDLDSDIYIKLNNVMTEEMDDSILFYVYSFDVLDSSNKTINRIEDVNGSKFYLNEALVKLCHNKVNINGSSVVFPLEDIEDDDDLFTVAIRNDELTAPLKIFNKVLNTPDHWGANTISELAQLFTDKLRAIGIKDEFVHAEMIIRALLRKKSNILEYPDFSISGDHDDCVILKLNDSHIYNPSALVSLPFGYIRKQLLSTHLYTKTSPGPLDALYVSNLNQFVN